MGTVVLLIAGLFWVQPAQSQTAVPPGAMPERGANCEATSKPDVPPTNGSASSRPLSDKLAQSKGVICPPAGVDPELERSPPGGGRLKVIPAPGTPGGDQSVEPK
jgi:hypothetical protein